MEALSRFANSVWYWIAVVATGLFLEAVALFYQHVLNEPPCVLCIQARVWTLAGILVAIAGIFLSKLKYGALAAQALLLVCLAGLLNRSWISVLVERNMYEGQCGMDPGFPSWLPLDQWFPNLFEVWTMCGYTPNFLFGLTMGEGLVAGSAALIAITLFASFLQIKNLNKQQGMA